MIDNKILEATNGVIAWIEPLTPSERKRVIQAALALLGDPSMQATVPLTRAIVSTVESQSALANPGYIGETEKNLYR